MNFSKHIEISNKIFSKADIVRLANILESEFKLHSNDSCDQNISFSIAFTDGSTITNETSDIFSEKSFEHKTINNISMKYYYLAKSKDISINIYTFESSFLSKISISCNNEDWFRTTESKLLECLYATQNINPLLILFNKIGFQAFFSPLLLILLYLFLPNILKEYPIIIVLFISLSFFSMFCLPYFMSKFYPLVQFSFGNSPKSSPMYRNSISILKFILFFIVIPFIVNHINSLFLNK